MVENVIQIKSGIVINVNVSVKNIIHMKKKDYICNHASSSCENGKYLANILNDSVITCDEIMESYNEETKSIPTNFNEKKIAGNTRIFYILLAFLLITIALLIAVSIY